MVAENAKLEEPAKNCFHYGNGGAIARLPSLKALRAFDAVARLNSVTAAAGELCVTPGAVSRQISSLEEAVGAALLRPDGRGCRLTADGELLERGLDGAFLRIAEAVERVRRSACGTRLRVCAGMMFASAWLIPRLDRFNRAAPDTEIILVDLNGPADWIGQADVVIDWGVIKSDTRMVAEKLSSNEEIFPVCRPGVCQDGRLDGATFLHLERTSEEPWRWPEWPEFLAAVDRSDTPLCSHYLSAGLLWRALRNGKGVTLLCSTLARDDIRSGNFVRPIGGSMATEDSYWVMTPRAALDRPEVGTFRSWLLDEFAASQ